MVDPALITWRAKRKPWRRESSDDAVTRRFPGLDPEPQPPSAKKELSMEHQT
jgi:hypothetical protein